MRSSWKKKELDVELFQEKVHVLVLCTEKIESFAWTFACFGLVRNVIVPAFLLQKLDILKKLSWL